MADFNNINIKICITVVPLSLHPSHHKTPFSYQVSLPSQNTFLLSGVPPITKHLFLIRCLPHHKTAFSYQVSPHHKTAFSYQVSPPSQNTFLLSGVPPITKHLSLIRCPPITKHLSLIRSDFTCTEIIKYY